MALLELKNVSKFYSGLTPALKDVNLTVEKGEFVSIIGPSGAGKTTLLRCINRLVEPSSGEIRFGGVVVSQLNKRALRSFRTNIGMIFQHYNLVERMSVIENVLHGRLGYKSTLDGIIGRYTKEEKTKAGEILQMLGLSEHIYKRCDQLSGGQKQRVGIARALVQDPRLILCDEPIASLDPNASKVIMDHLRTISTEMGITLVVSLHQVDVAVKYSDRIIGVKGGTVVFDGLPSSLNRETISEIYGSESEDLLIALGERNAS